MRVILCCLMLLSSSVVTDAYGLSLSLSKKSRNTVKEEIMHAKQVAPVSDHNNTITDASITRPQLRQTAPENQHQQTKMIKSDNKLSYEIIELNRMYNQLTRETANDPTNLGKLQLKQEIEKQLNIRTMQQLSKGTSRRNKAYNRYPTLPSPVQSNRLQRTFISQNNVLPNLQSLNQQGVNPQHFIHQNQLRRLNVIDNSALHQIPAGHVLVPVSSLSSAGILNNRGVLSNRIIIMKSLKDNLVIPVKTTTKKLPAGSLTSTSDSSPLKEQPSSTSSLPTSTTSVPVSTATSDLDLTTTPDAAKLKHTYLKGKIKKQRLQIRKLRLHIQAILQDQEIEQEDVMQHTPVK